MGGSPRGAVANVFHLSHRRDQVRTYVTVLRSLSV